MIVCDFELLAKGLMPLDASIDEPIVLFVSEPQFCVFLRPNGVWKPKRMFHFSQRSENLFLIHGLISVDWLVGATCIGPHLLCVKLNKVNKLNQNSSNFCSRISCT